MKNSSYSPSQWRHLIPNIGEAIQAMEQIPILSVGITPYTRIIPAFFLKNYSIYTIKRSSDVDVMEQYLPMNVLEDYHPAIAKKVHGTGYLIGNHAFQAFLKSRRPSPKLLFYTMTDKIVQDLDRLGFDWIGNNPSTFKSVAYKGPFRQLIKEMGLPSLNPHLMGREEFLSATFETLRDTFSGSFVVQRADKETGGNEGTFFIHALEDFHHCISVLGADTQFSELSVSPFVKGHSTSMLGCVTPQGILSGPLQLQLIDVPESLHGVNANGIFFGNDIGFVDWGDDIEQAAQEAIERVGEHLAAQGYKGIFGIDFLYDKERNVLYANECNPRFTGSLVLYSLMLLEAGVPPLEFFHLAAQLNVPLQFDIRTVNAALKQRIPCAHIAFSPKGISHMKLPLLAGVYEYNPNEAEALRYVGKGISLADIQNENQFLLADTVHSFNSTIEQGVPRLFKFIFSKSIALSSYSIEKREAFLVRRFADALSKASQG